MTFDKKNQEIPATKMMNIATTSSTKYTMTLPLYIFIFTTCIQHHENMSKLDSLFMHDVIGEVCEVKKKISFLNVLWFK